MENETTNFIHKIIDEDIENGKTRVVTRFPPEPNGYLHIGHAKAFSINFGTALKYKGLCHLRFDDTNPLKEETEFVESIKEDIKWMGYSWNEHLYFASDYFEKMYEYALRLIKSGDAYVDDLTTEEIRRYRGTLTSPGKDSPFRNRTPEENLELFIEMKKGAFRNGEKVLRAKIDMSSPNINLRDPVMYRILHAEHHRTGNTWCIYPMYDWAHGIEDSIEGITHSLCSLEFEDHRPLYDWFLEKLKIHHPRQIEFARFNLTYTVMSKRKLKELVDSGIVTGWDDPGMPTLKGLRRRGYTPESIRNFLNRIGVAKNVSVVDMALLEHCLREDLNKKANRVMGVLNPLKVVIDNYPEDKEEELDAVNNPEDPECGTRKIPFSREIYIEKDDFMEDPPKKFYRLSPGREIRLKHAYYIKCKSFIKDKTTGEVVEIHCTYDPATKGGWSDDGRKVKGTSHWVSVKHAVKAEVRIYEYLFTSPEPENGNFMESINPDSKKILKSVMVEPCLKNPVYETKYQFLRQGYFCVDKDSKPGAPVFNRIVSLRDTWAKIQKNKQNMKK